MIAVYSISQDDQGWSIFVDGDAMESGLPLGIAVRASVLAAARRYRNDPRSDTKVVFRDRGADHTLWRNGEVSSDDRPEAAAPAKRAA
jgi:hypothetical protein